MKLWVIHDYSGWGYSVVRAYTQEAALDLVAPNRDKKNPFRRMEVVELLSEGEAGIICRFSSDFPRD